MDLYRVIDTHTKTVVGRYSTRRAATLKADKLDLEYGAYRYQVEKTPIDWDKELQGEEYCEDCRCYHNPPTWPTAHCFVRQR